MHTTESAPAFSYACGTISAKLSRGERVLLQDVSFSLSSGERMAIIGETGSGKTMLALSILGLLPANVRMQGGCIQMDGAALPAGKGGALRTGSLGAESSGAGKAGQRGAAP